MSAPSNDNNNMFTQAAQIDEIFRSLGRIETQLNKISENYMTAAEVSKLIISLEDRILQRVKPLEKLVYGLVSIVLTSVVGAILALVILRP